MFNVFNKNGWLIARQATPEKVAELQQTIVGGVDVAPYTSKQVYQEPVSDPILKQVCQDYEAYLRDPLS